MLYSRIVIKNKNLNTILEDLNCKLKSEFEFYDLIYISKLGKSITEDTLKIRVYKKNEWDTKDVLVIRKTASLINGAKEDKVLLQEEFDDLESAQEYVNNNFKNEFVFAFKLSKCGKEYISDKCRIWLEEIENFGLSVEIEASTQQLLNDVISKFDVVEKLEKSIPEIMYEKIVKKI